MMLPLLKTSRWTLKPFSCLQSAQLLLFLVFMFAKTISALEKTPIGNAQTEMGKNITEILNTIITKGYDKRVRPNYAGPPVDVGIAVYIISISSVSEVQMDFTADIYFRQSWKDNRLSFQARAGINQMVVGAEVANYVWNPDTFFGNEKSAQFHKATTPNTFIRIGSNGEVYRSTRLTVTSTCPMNLRYFPMDRQECTIEVESYGYSMADIMYRWGIGGKPGVEMADVKLPQFKVKGYQNKSIIQDEASGKYSRLICEIELVRSLGYYLIQIYIPSSLIVIISWVSFWLHRNASPARVQLGVTTVLTMTTLMSSTNAALPKISYVKSIDVFLGTCFVMVFAALLEYATVGYMGKRIALRTAKVQAKQMNSNNARRQTGVKAIVSTSQVEMGPILRPPHVVSQSVCEPLLGHPSLRLRRPEGETTYTTAAGGGGAPGPGAPGPGAAGGTGGAIGNAVSAGAAEHQTPRPSVDVPKKKESEPAEPAPSIPFPGSKPASTLFGISPSDIDKYSRVIFPVCFLCFHLMYWLIYTHISSFLEIEAEEPSS